MSIHPPYRRPLGRALVMLALGGLLLAVLMLLPEPRLELPPLASTALHAALELASVVASLLIFSVGWATYSRHRGRLVPLLGGVFLAAAVLDFVHALVAEGMPLHQPQAGMGHAIASYLVARVLVAVALAVVACTSWAAPLRRCGLALLFGGAFALAAGLSAWSLLDDTLARQLHGEGGDPTAPRLLLESLVLALSLVAAVAFLRRMTREQGFPVVPLFAACALMAMSGLCFMLFRSDGDLVLHLGHLLKVLAYASVYQAMVGETLRRPRAELAQARAELERSEGRYRLLFEHNMDALLMLDDDGVIQDANSAARSVLRMPPDRRLAGMDARTFADSSDDRLAGLLDTCGATGRARGELRVRRADGTVMEAEVSTAAYADAAGRPLFSWGVRDLTERQRARDQILQLNATLEARVRHRTAQLEALNQELESFSYTVAHDLRAPLAAIDGFSEALANQLEGRLQEREQRFLQRIRASSRKMGEMIDVLLELGRLSRSQLAPEPVDLAQLACEVVDDLRSAAPDRKVDIRLEGPLRVEGDRRLLRLALENLIGNAWKFTGRQPAPRIEVGRCGQRDGVPLFFVRDNGAGFDMEHARHLFGAFQRLHGQDEFPGHGVGLANVSRIVRLHGGEIWADARPGVGATFFFTLGRAAPVDDKAAPLGTMAP